MKLIKEWLDLIKLGLEAKYEMLSKIPWFEFKYFHSHPHDHSDFPTLDLVVKFFWIRQGGTHNSDAKIILKVMLIQK